MAFSPLRIPGDPLTLARGGNENQLAVELTIKRWRLLGREQGVMNAPASQPGTLWTLAGGRVEHLHSQVLACTHKQVGGEQWAAHAF